MKNKLYDAKMQEYINGNQIDFRAWLRKLSKADLMRFACFVATYYEEYDIFWLEKEYNR